MKTELKIEWEKHVNVWPDKVGGTVYEWRCYAWFNGEIIYSDRSSVEMNDPESIEDLIRDYSKPTGRAYVQVSHILRAFGRADDVTIEIDLPKGWKVNNYMDMGE